MPTRPGRIALATAGAIAIALLCTPDTLRAATDSVTTCGAPQLIGAAQALNPGVTSSNGPAIAWSDHEFGAIWVEVTSLRFARVYADGTLAAPPVTVATGAATNSPAIVWNGSGYGIAYTASASPQQVFFVRIDRSGTVLSGPTRVSVVGGTPVGAASNAAIAWSGSGYLVAWPDRRGADADVYMTLLDANGSVTAHDLSFAAASDQVQVTAAWSVAGNHYVMAWTDLRSGIRDEIGTGYVSQAGVPASNAIEVTGTGQSFQPTLVDNGSTLGLAWVDNRDGNNEIYFTVLSSNGVKAGPDLRVTNDSASSTVPLLFWTGNEYGLIFDDTRVTSLWPDIFYQRINASAALVGSNVQLTGWINASQLRAAFANHGYVALFTPTGPIQALAIGCTTPTTPSCPEAPDAYSISGTTATVAWLPSVDRNFDIAYYEVFRNDALVGTTSANVYNDTGLAPGTTYQYNFRAMNAADMESFGCTGAQIYVKSSAALSLGVSQSNGDINLSWNSDGSNTYRVMRGTSPQVMTQIQSTASTSTTDFNAAQGPVCYFYSIDEPPPTSP